jgi:hypothetical protein
VATAHQRVTLLAALACLLASAACDNNDTFTTFSPVGPTVTARLSGGAVINGRVSGSDLALPTGQIGGATAPRVGIAPPGISTVVGSDGNFTLTGVPPGTVTLIISSNGFTTGTVLTNVHLDDLIALDVHVNSGVATIESEHRRRRGSTTTE